MFNYASPSSREAFRDWQLTTNIELWVEMFCVPSAHMLPYKDSVSVWLSVATTEKRNHPGFVNISFTLVIDASIEKFSEVASYSMETQKFDFFFKNVRSWILTCAKSQNHLNFANITPTLVIYTSMERSSRVLQHGNLKFEFFSNSGGMLLIACHQNWLPLLYFLTGACLPDSFCCHIL